MKKGMLFFALGLVMGYFINKILQPKEESLVLKPIAVVDKVIPFEEKKEAPLPPVEVLKVDNEGMKKNYYLQLGAFKYPYFSDRLISKVKKLGYTVHVHKIQRKNDELTVVEVGPFKKKEQALKHRFVIADKIGTEGKILFKSRIE